MALSANEITLYSTCLSTVEHDQKFYLRELLRIARWSDDAGYRGALVYSDSTSIDAWMAAQATIANTASFVPLVAVQPIDMTPFACARAVSSLAHLYGRSVDINFVSGGFGRDLAGQGDDVPHDARYHRLTEYVAIIQRLLKGELVNFTGQYYNLRRTRLPVPTPADLMPTAYMSGSSPASVQAGESLGIGQLSYPLPPEDFVGPNVAKNRFGSGIRLGIIARDDSAEAWRIARKRFPVTPEGAEKMKLLLSASVSSWQSALGSLDVSDEPEAEAYWLVPFRYYHSFSPYLVGSYEEVGQAVAKYLAGGARAFVLDVPEEPDDMHHARIAIEHGVAVLNGSAS